MEIFVQEFEPVSYFCDWTCVHFIMNQHRSPKFDFQSQFSMSKISFIILIFVPFKIIRLGEQLIINHFLITSFFEVQGVPILKIQKFLSGMLILMQKPCNFVNFVPLLWKLYNPYCHATGDPQIVRILCSQGIVLLQKSY